VVRASRPAFVWLQIRSSRSNRPFIADFVCREKNLIVEVDGGQHSDNASDKRRDSYLSDEGYRVLRFWNNDVLTNREGVLLTILDALQ
jgi:very-short-patch-repair endonuclease